jgi:hypothetical protein
MMPKIVVRSLSEEEIKQKEIRNWPIWEKEVSRFDWSYDADEECLILEGRFNVETDEGIFSFGPGDFILFPQGLSCIWDITENVRKHYNFL